jgi:hypothetical protein
MIGIERRIIEAQRKTQLLGNPRNLAYRIHYRGNDGTEQHHIQNVYSTCYRGKPIDIEADLDDMRL